MPLSKPFYRIVRPFIGGEYFGGNNDKDNYILSSDYASDRVALIRAYTIIENDLIQLFNYIEPAEDNLGSYSHKTYELLLRASTEFETNCKAILNANGYSKKGGTHLNIEDYYRINQATRLSEYKAILDTWIPSSKVFQRFVDWSSGPTLRWYRSYNAVKHDRSREFREASFANALSAVTGLLCILFSQFHAFVFNPYQNSGGYLVGEDSSIHTDTSLFRVVPSTTWPQADHYKFEWNAVRATMSPLETFAF